jgi:hypothetical protein
MARTIEHGWMCSNNTNWSRVVHSRSGETYVVSFGRVENPRQRGVQHDFYCTCPDFQFRKRGEAASYCKHIKRVQKERCTWHTQFNGPASPIMEGGEAKCPLCHASAISIRFQT